MILLALVTGLIGGVLSSQLFTIQTVFAEKEPKPQKLVIAEEFRLVDKKGNTITRLHEGPYGRPIFFIGRHKGICTSISDKEIKIVKGNRDPWIFYAEAGDLYTKGPIGVVEIDSKGHGPHITLTQCRSEIGETKKEWLASSTLGCTDLVTKKAGTKITRSAASLVLFDEKGNVIWSTPQ
jgi:hypothetical protein